MTWKELLDNPKGVESFEKVWCRAFPCYYCKSPSRYLAITRKEKKWRYVCSVCYELLSCDPPKIKEFLQRLKEKGIRIYETYGKEGMYYWFEKEGD